MPICPLCIERLGIEGKGERGNCDYCGGLLEHIDDFLGVFKAASEGYEFKTFLIGLRAEEALISKDRKFIEETGRNCRNFKKEFEYRLGSKIESSMNMKADFSKPEVVFTVDQRTMSYDFWVRPVFVTGRYLKKARGIPQSPWISPAPGREGKSISEFIGESATLLLGGRDYSFYASGREDVDALMLGDGRPFYVKVFNPRKRVIDPDIFAKTVRDASGGRVDVVNPKIAEGKEVDEIRKMRPSKVYEVKLTMDRKIDENVLRKLISYSGIYLSQRTPSRVLPIRKDMIRRRRIEKVEVLENSENSITLLIEAEAGTYIKEFITGDSGRTQPNISGDLKVNVKIDYLNVLKVK